MSSTTEGYQQAGTSVRSTAETSLEERDDRACMSSTTEGYQQAGTSVRSTAETSLEERDDRACLSAFPSRLRSSASGGSLSDGRSSSVSSLKCRLEDPDVILQQRLRDVTKFAFIDLIASILRFDFWDFDDADSVYVVFII
uniref:Transmembrane protein n=1 Tax=Ascaris lumbricoides TaxID=6252 RepID=A0A0M3IWZ7_ASCLU